MSETEIKSRGLLIQSQQRRIQELDAQCAEMRLAVTDLFAPHRDNPNASLIAVSRERFIRHDNVLSTTAGQSTLKRIAVLEEALRIIPPRKLTAIAEWLDKEDLMAGRTGHEVQDDLRALAKASFAALEGSN